MEGDAWIVFFHELVEKYKARSQFFLENKGKISPSVLNDPRLFMEPNKIAEFNSDAYKNGEGLGKDIFTFEQDLLTMVHKDKCLEFTDDLKARMCVLF